MKLSNFRINNVSPIHKIHHCAPRKALIHEERKEEIMKKRELRSWLIALAFQLVWVPLFFMEPEEEYIPPEEVIEEDWDLIRWKQE